MSFTRRDKICEQLFASKTFVKIDASILPLNAHSLGAPGMVTEVAALLRELRVDVLAVSETWQKEGKYYDIAGYRYLGKTRKLKIKVHGGEVGFLSQKTCDARSESLSSPSPATARCLRFHFCCVGSVVSTWSAPISSHKNDCRNATQSSTPLPLRAASPFLAAYS